MITVVPFFLRIQKDRSHYGDAYDLPEEAQTDF